MLEKRIFTWSRFGGYECSSKGDKRFSALNAVMSDGRTLEMHYQLDVKRINPGGTNWRAGKGKPPIGEVDLWAGYLFLWQQWAGRNLPLMRELYINASSCNCVLSDMFATTPISQARALAYILNELVAKGKHT